MLNGDQLATAHDSGVNKTRAARLCGGWVRLPPVPQISDATRARRLAFHRQLLRAGSKAHGPEESGQQGPTRRRPVRLRSRLSPERRPRGIRRNGGEIFHGGPTMTVSRSTPVRGCVATSRRQGSAHETASARSNSAPIRQWIEQEHARQKKETGRSPNRCAAQKESRTSSLPATASNRSGRRGARIRSRPSRVAPNDWNASSTASSSSTSPGLHGGTGTRSDPDSPRIRPVQELSNLRRQASAEAGCGRCEVVLYFDDPDAGRSASGCHVSPLVFAVCARSRPASRAMPEKSCANGGIGAARDPRCAH